MKKIRISVGQYVLTPFHDWKQYEKHFTHYVQTVKSENTDLLLMPEYMGLALNMSHSESVEAIFCHIAKWQEDYLNLCASLAKQYNIYIQPGTLPFRTTENTWRNRAYFFHPNGRSEYQDKTHLHLLEQDTKLLTPGDYLSIIETNFCKLAIAIGNDVHFPSFINKLANENVHVLLVPSATLSKQEYYRTHIACRARAAETNMAVALSCLIQNHPGNSFLDRSIGCAGIFTPLTSSFHDDGIQLMGEWNTPEQYCVDVQISV